MSLQKTCWDRSEDPASERGADDKHRDQCGGPLGGIKISSLISPKETPHKALSEPHTHSCPILFLLTISVSAPLVSETNGR